MCYPYKGSTIVAIACYFSNTKSVRVRTNREDKCFVDKDGGMKKGAEENEGGSLVVFPWESACPVCNNQVLD